MKILGTEHKLNIAFHTNQICLLGTEVSLFDYADFCEKFYGHKSIVISKKNRIKDDASSNVNQPLALKKFRIRFPLYLYDDISDIDKILRKEKIDVFYAQKRGDIDGIESRIVKTVIHTVFKYYEPHGSVYAYISKWLSDVMTNGSSPYVPYMINLPRVKGNLREILQIPNDAIVFGRYGGMDSFDLNFVHELIIKTVHDNKDIHFIFMNTRNFLNLTDSFLERLKSKINPKFHPQIHFLPPTSSSEYKSKFINSCNAMLHARSRGETFGAAIGEFSIHNCPVITYAGAGSKKFESNHIALLDEKCFKYNNTEELRNILEDFRHHKDNFFNMDWDAYSTEYSPKAVMDKFNNVFLK